MGKPGAVCVRVLGGFQIILPDGTVAGPWARPSARRVLQVLLLRQGKRIGREELAGLLFPDRAPERVANSLSKALSMARVALAPYDLVKADRDMVWLDGDIEVDALSQRDRLRQAMALQPGDARDAALTDGLEQRGRLFEEETYADWAEAERNDLEALRASARLALARDRTAGYGPASAWAAIDAWRSVMAQDASNEEACAASVTAYGDAGMRDMAVRTYHRTARALHELGLEPSTLLVSTYAGALTTARRGPPPMEAFTSTRRIFGRDAVLLGLRECVLKRSRHSSSSVLVSGPAGIGKSAVLDALADDLRAGGWLVVRAGAAIDDHLAPLRALRSALGQIDLDDAGALVRQLAYGLDSNESHEEWRTERARFLHELIAVLDAQAQQQPLVVILDDVQWMDAGLREILAELMSSSDGHRWTMVLGARTDDVGDTGVPMQHAATFDLMPLPSDAVAELVRHITPGLAEEAVARAVTRSRGNPFFAVELARQAFDAPGDDTLSSNVPTLIVELLNARLARCSLQAQRLLSLVSLLGDKATVDELLRISSSPGVDSEPDATMRAIDELVAVHLLEELSDGVRLVHPLLREAAVAQLNPTQRSALHRLIAAGSDDEAGAFHRLAAFEAGGLREYARAGADAGFIAGRRARRLFAHDAALELFEGGLRAFKVASAPDRNDLRAAAFDAWCQLGEIHQDRERRAEADLAYEAALALATSDEERSRAWSGTGWSAYRVGDLPGCVFAYESGLSSLHHPSPAVRAELESDLGWAYFRLGRTGEALAALERAAANLGDLTEPLVRGRMLDRLATVLGATGRAQEGLAVMYSAFDAVGVSGDERELGILHIHRATLYAEVRRFGEALADASAALRVATARGDPYIQSVARWAAAFVHERRGDWTAALAERDAEIAVLAKVGNPRNEALAQIARARLLLALGRHEESEAAAAVARELSAPFDQEAFLAQARHEIGSS